MLNITPKSFPKINGTTAIVEKLDIRINANRNINLDNSIDGEIIIYFIENNNQIFNSTKINFAELQTKIQQFGYTESQAKTKTNSVFNNLLTKPKNETLPIIAELAQFYGYEVLSFE